jgi:hypothetical protein
MHCAEKGMCVQGVYLLQRSMTRYLVSARSRGTMNQIPPANQYIIPWDRANDSAELLIQLAIIKAASFYSYVMSYSI